MPLNVPDLSTVVASAAALGALGSIKSCWNESPVLRYSVLVLSMSQFLFQLSHSRWRGNTREELSKATSLTNTHVARFLARFYIPAQATEARWTAYAMAFVGFLDDIGLISVKYVTSFQVALVACDICLMRRATSLQPAQEVVIAQDEEREWTKKVSTMLTALASCIALSLGVSQIKTGEGLSAWVKRCVDCLFSVARGASGLMTFFSLMIDFVTWILNWLMGRLRRGTLLQSIVSENKEFIDSWMCEVQDLSRTEIVREKGGDLDYLHRVEIAYRVANHLMRDLAKLGKTNHGLAHLCKTIINVRQSCMSAHIKHSFRREPYVIWMCGDGGIGKSQYSEHLVLKLFRSAAIQITGNPVYVFQNQTKHWTGCDGKKALIFDDFCINASQESTEQMIEVFQRLKSCALFIPEMAAIEHKGHPFEPEVIIICSNQKYPSHITINNEQAFHRRIDMRVHLRVREGVARTASQVVELTGSSIGEFDHLEFAQLPIHHSANSNSALTYVSLQEFEQQVTTAFPAFREKQKLLYKKKMDNLMDAILESEEPTSLEVMYERITAETAALMTAVNGGSVGAWKDKCVTIFNTSYNGVKTVFSTVKDSISGLVDDIRVRAQSEVPEEENLPVIAQRGFGNTLTFQIPTPLQLRQMMQIARDYDPNLRMNNGDLGLYSRLSAWNVVPEPIEEIDDDASCMHDALAPFSSHSIFSRTDMITLTRGDVSSNLPSSILDRFRRPMKYFAYEYHDTWATRRKLATFEQRYLSAKYTPVRQRGYLVVENSDRGSFSIELHGVCDPPCSREVTNLTFEFVSRLNRDSPEEVDLSDIRPATQSETMRKLKEYTQKIRAVFFEPGTWEPTSVTVLLLPTLVGVGGALWLTRKRTQEAEEERKLDAELAALKGPENFSSLKQFEEHYAEWKAKQSAQKTWKSAQVEKGEVQVVQTVPSFDMDTQAAPNIYDVADTRSKDVRNAKVMRRTLKTAVKRFQHSLQGQGGINANIPITAQQQYRYFAWGDLRFPIFGLCGKSYITLKHFVKNFQRHGFTYMIKGREGTVLASGEKKDIIITEAPDSEVVVLTVQNPRLPLIRCFLKHFVSDDRVESLPTNCTILSVTNMECVLLTQVSTHFNKTYAVEMDNGEKSSAVSTTIIYNWGFPGACLSTVFMDAPATKLVGFHIAGKRNGSTGISEIVVRESFSDFCQCTVPPPTTITEVEETVVAEGGHELVSFMKSGRVVEESLVEYLPPSRTQIMSSPLAIYGRTVTQPAPLCPEAVDNHFDPYLEGVKHHVGAVPQFREDVLAEIETEMKDWLSIAVKPVFQGIEPLSDDKVVNGIPGIDSFPGIVLSTAEGYPYQFSRPAGEKADKNWLIKKQPCWIHPMVQDIRARNRSYRVNKQRAPTVFIDCLKDARIPVEKYMRPGATRIFSIGPTDFILDFRQYVGHFFSAFQAARFDACHAVGINPDSTDWTKLYDHLTGGGAEDFCCGDYSKFGPTLAPQVMTVAKYLVIDWYKKQGATTEHLNIIACLFDELIHSRHLYKAVIYETDMGSPSGAPPTALLNCLCNLIYIIYVWKRVFKKSPLLKTLNSMFKYLRIITYGDDIVIAVLAKILQHFNNGVIQRVLGDCGIVYTDATKSGDIRMSCKLPDVTFLKRSFLKHPTRDNLWLAPLDTIAIEECPYWIKTLKSGSTMEQATDVNVRMSLRLAFSRGPEYYNKQKEKLIQQCTSANVSLDHGSMFTWEALDALIFDGKESLPADLQELWDIYQTDFDYL